MNFELEAIHGDITVQHVDAIVNAANTALKPGGGVDGAIRHAAGTKKIIELLSPIVNKGGINTGEAIITPGGSLPAKYIIWTAGPIYQNGNNNEPKLLENAYRNSIEIAIKYKIQSIAFPFISTGVFGYPKFEASTIAIETVYSTLVSNNYNIRVYFVLFSRSDYELFVQKLSTK